MYLDNSGTLAPFASAATTHTLYVFRTLFFSLLFFPLCFWHYVTYSNTILNTILTKYLHRHDVCGITAKIASRSDSAPVLRCNPGTTRSHRLYTVSNDDCVGTKTA